jgi:hypothetical protein
MDMPSTPGVVRSSITMAMNAKENRTRSELSHCKNGRNDGNMCVLFPVWRVLLSQEEAY